MLSPITPTATPDEVRALWARRYTAKALDPCRPVAEDDLDAILESARLSASSMGMEPWHFLVLTPGPLFTAVTTHCWGYHPQASHLVILLGRNPDHFTSPGEYVRHIHVDVQGRDPEDLPARYDQIRRFLTQDLALSSDESVRGWIDRQVYIALGSMIMSAAMLGVDATPIEGLAVREVERALVEADTFDPAEYHLVSALALGHTSREAHRPKTRRDPSEVITRL